MEKRTIWRQYKKQWIWILLGGGALFLRGILQGYPQFIEHYYSRGLFLVIRWLIDYVVAWLPIPLIYIFFSVLLLWLIRKTTRFFRSEESLGKKITSTALSVFAFAGGTLFFFLFLWGFNYGRVPVEDQLELPVKPVSLAEIKEELELETRIIKKLRKKIPGITDSAFTAALLPKKLETLLRKELEIWLASHSYPVVGRVRGRSLYPKGVFMRFSSSGLYFPFTGEGHVDAGLHPLQRASVMAHELSHGYGFADEGTCNFLAYLSCSQSENLAVAYAGHLNYWRTLAVNYLSYYPQKYRKFRSELPQGIQADLNAINENNAKYPDIMPRLRFAAYDTYLKAQGIDEGMKNYNRVIMLARAWRKNKGI